MIRALLLLVAGVLLGGIVHLAAILVLPRTATRDAYSRLSPITKVNAMVPLPAPSARDSILPYMDPAFASAVCRYDLAQGPIKLTAPVSQSYTSVTFYTQQDIAFYAINDRAAGRRVIELHLMTAQQHADLPEDENVTAADRLIIDSPSERGLIVLRALAAEPGLMPKTREALAQARCDLEPQ